MKYTFIQKGKYQIAMVSKFGISRTVANEQGLICSRGTARAYLYPVANFLQYLSENAICKPKKITPKIAEEYLTIRSEEVKQNTLDLIRQALQITFKLELKYVKSELEEVLTSRSYSNKEVSQILIHQQPRNRLATELAFAVGLRAHELSTLDSPQVQPRSCNRNWHEKMFLGLENFEIYTVKGKGGLIREVAIPNRLAKTLEKRRLEIPKLEVDREIRYFSNFDISCGQKWSQSFSAASKVGLGFSNGAHGLRHSFAQKRMRTVNQRPILSTSQRPIFSTLSACWERFLLCLNR